MKNDRQGDRGGSNSIFFKDRARLIFSVMLIALAVFSAVMTVKVLRLNPVTTQITPGETRLRRITYDYQVYPRVSLLYPLGTSPLAPGGKSYFANITDRIEFQVTGEIEVPPPAKPEGSMRIALLLRSPGQWEKKMDLTPVVILERADEGKLVFKSSFILPLAPAAGLGEAVAEELGVRPRDAYSLVVQSTMTCPPLGTTYPMAQDSPLLGEYAFNLRGRTIEPEGELVFQKSEEAKEAGETAPQANYFSLGGHLLSVSQARVFFLFLLTISLLGLGLCARARPRPSAEGEDPGAVQIKRIRRRYGRRIIRVGPLENLPPASLRINMPDMRELVKLADERERPILEVAGQGEQKDSLVQYYVIDEDTLYCYQVSNV